MQPPSMRRLIKHYDALVPIAFLTMMAAPVIIYMLPAYESYISEIYQPLRALRFMASFGQDYHKWGVMPNLLLAPGYAVTIAYWYATGQFSAPSGDFPYGLSDPLHQLTFLILQGRILFFLIALCSLTVLVTALRRVTADRVSILLAVFFAVSSNIIVIRLWPSMKPDGPMLSFCALSLAVYIRIATNGFTTSRGVWLSLSAVGAVSSKELAATLFILPYIAVAYVGWREAAESASRRRFVRGYVISLVTGMTAYSVLNVVYAPGIWWRRMAFWTTGAGKDPDIWGGQEGLSYIAHVAYSIVNNLGPGGTLIFALAMIGATIPPRRITVMLAMPALSILFIGLLPMGYAHDRFYMPFALCLVPPAALGLARLRVLFAARPTVRIIALLLTAVALAANTDFATFTWHQLRTLKQASIDRYVQARLSKDDTINIFSLWPVPPGKERLNIFGYRQDGRSIIDLSREPVALPRWILTDSGSLDFLTDARRYPKRAAMLLAETGLDAYAWDGLRSLGYESVERIEPIYPWWFAFSWMPAPREHSDLSTLEVYRLNDGSP